MIDLLPTAGAGAAGAPKSRKLRSPPSDGGATDNWAAGSGAAARRLAEGGAENRSGSGVGAGAGAGVSKLAKVSSSTSKVVQLYSTQNQATKIYTRMCFLECGCIADDKSHKFTPKQVSN